MNDRDELMRWFPYWSARRQPALLRLLCFPYAGGAAASYRGWTRAFDADTEVCAVELPGRWARLREEPYETIADIVDGVERALALLPSAPLVVFGYSMGSLAAFEMVRRLRDKGQEPVHLIAAARGAPNLRAEPLLHLPDHELLDRIARLYAPVPQALLEDPEMRSTVMRLTRADLACVENYRFQPGPKLSLPLTVLGGAEDPSTPLAALDDWKEQTRGPFETRSFPGGHFFINSMGDAIVALVRDALANARARCVGSSQLAAAPRPPAGQEAELS
jgi:medium-chain acyl-[acyl-carrier-protein] hydrolase